MTTVQRVAQVFGWIFVLVAVWGFFVTGGSMEADPELAPQLWGLFPVNVLHNLVHLAFGIWGIMAARSFSAAKSYGQIAGVLYLVLAALGFVIPSTFGLIPIGGNDIWLHILLGAVLAGVGFTAGPDAGTTAGAGAARVEPGGTRTTTSPTASSPEGTTTRPPAEPVRPPAHDRPVPPETAGSGGASPASPPPPPPDDVVDRPPQQSDRPGSPPPPPGERGGDRTP